MVTLSVPSYWINSLNNLNIFNQKGAKAMISKRLLTKWRKEALETEYMIRVLDPNGATSIENSHRIELSERILRLTQELLDQELLRRT